MDRDRPAPVHYLAGVPRYQIGRAGRGLVSLAAYWVGFKRESEQAARFEHELACWDLAGFCWGKHLHRVPSRQTPVKSAGVSAPAFDRTDTV
jgi:hypothetical protein